MNFDLITTAKERTTPSRIYLTATLYPGMIYLSPMMWDEGD